MSLIIPAGQGPGRRGSHHSRIGGTNTPSRGHRSGSGSGAGGSDNVLPLITGVLGSSILAFSLYVFSQKPGVFGAEVNEPTVLLDPEHTCHPENPEYSGAAPLHQEWCENSEAEPCPIYETEPTINVEKKKWLTPEEEALMREKQKNRRQLQTELKHHLRKAKELTEELERDETAKSGNWRV